MLAAFIAVSHRNVRLSSSCRTNQRNILVRIKRRERLQSFQLAYVFSVNLTEVKARKCLRGFQRELAQSEHHLN